MLGSILTLVTLTEARAGEDPWTLIAGVEYREIIEGNDWRVEKTLPPPLLEAAKRPFTVSGYYVPIEAQAYVTNFLLVPDPENCPFCGSSGIGILLEVFASEPMPDLPEGTEVTLTGTLEIVDDPFTYQAVKLVDARPVSKN